MASSAVLTQATGDEHSSAAQRANAACRVVGPGLEKFNGMAEGCDDRMGFFSVDCCETRMVSPSLARSSRRLAGDVRAGRRRSQRGVRAAHKSQVSLLPVD